MHILYNNVYTSTYAAYSVVNAHLRRTQVMFTARCTSSTPSSIPFLFLLKLLLLLFLNPLLPFSHYLLSLITLLSTSVFSHPPPPPPPPPLPHSSRVFSYYIVLSSETAGVN